ncbi:HD domain-containing phosphohydrolase [Clostridium minihomine]|uniref:HD domain-containing phosphohydrolase n=1 Tax=Clostridium minihomine TaxID=2045012 RepID=UPI000C795630|nr:HD domain-containing phosphohydrolase [Clostridium minihomine]
MRFRLKSNDHTVSAPIPVTESIDYLIKIVQQLSATHDLPGVMKLVCHSACTLTGCRRAAFLLLGGESCHCATDQSVPVLCRRMCSSIDTLVGELVLKERQPILISNMENDSRIPSKLSKNTFLKSLAMLPIRPQDPIGIIGCYWTEPHSPTREQMRVLQALADTAAISIDNIRYRQDIAKKARELEKAMDGTLLAIARIVEQKDPYTSGHQQRVSRLAYDIAREMGWKEERCEVLRRAALVHDIGKIGIPGDLLTKPSQLTPLEKELIQTHAEIGYQIVKDISFFVPLAEIIRQHHERLDGSGYPRGLKSDEMLPEAKVLAVADVFEAMTSHRPYRPALSPSIAFDELLKNRGTCYDSLAVDTLFSMITEKKYQIPE